MEGTSAVVDFGSGAIKAELASVEVPKIFHNIWGTHKNRPLLPAAASGPQALYCNDAMQNRGLLKLRYAMDHGQIKDMDAAAAILKHVVSSLGVPNKDHPILLTEPPLADRNQRAKLAQILFEDMQHPAAIFAVQGVLSLFASGQTTGVVLDIGDGITQACPVIEGYSLRDATRRVDFGGRDLTRFMQHLTRQRGNFFTTSAEFECVRLMKEECCTVQPIAKRDINPRDVALTKHRLPDGTEVALHTECVEVPELLFEPSLFGFEYPSVVNVVADCVKSADLDLRKDLYENVFLAGGTTTLPKFCERFLPEMAKVTPRACTVRVHAPADRRLTAWTGASFLAQLTSFRDMLTTRAEYAEQGERILHNKLFA